MKIPGLELSGDVRELPWRETQVEGVFWIPLFLESWERDSWEEREPAEARDAGARGGGTVLIRMDPGCGYPAHRHCGGEEVLVLAGSYTDEFGTHAQGQYVHYPPHSSHGPVADGDAGRPPGPDNPACVLFATAVGGIELVDATR